jgi:hypothetical protein
MLKADMSLNLLFIPAFTFQVEMAGSSIFDYVHQGDHAEVAEQLGLSLTGHSQGMASPSSSDDGTTHGTMNPDGNLTANFEDELQLTEIESLQCRRACRFNQTTNIKASSDLSAFE